MRRRDYQEGREETRVPDRSGSDYRCRAVDHRPASGLGIPTRSTGRRPERRSREHRGKPVPLYTFNHDTFVIERTYDSPVARVFRAWADPKRKARWFAGSADALGNGYELDFQVGGREVNRGGPPGGPVYTYSAEIRDIVVDRRIVSTSEMFADNSLISVTVATVEFYESGGATQLVLTEQGVFLDGQETAAQREDGTRSLLDSLATSLAGDEP